VNQTQDSKHLATNGVGVQNDVKLQQIAIVTSRDQVKKRTSKTCDLSIGTTAQLKKETINTEAERIP
jgi:hypothetical protein